VTTPEDRLAGALHDRAAAARTSPDALDGVFRKVATHRRRTRAVSGAGLAVALVAGGVATAAVMRPGKDSLTPVPPASQGVTATPSESESPSPSAPASASVSPSPSVPVAIPDKSAVLLLADRRVAVVSTTTGEELASLGTLPSDAEGSRLAWSREGDKVWFGRSGCRIGVLDTTTGEVGDAGTGTDPNLSPGGTKLAAVACDRPDAHGNGVVVTNLATGAVKTYQGIAPWPEGGAPSLARTLDWLDDTRLAVAVAWEDPEGVVVLDTTKDEKLNDGTWLRINVESPFKHGDELLGVQRCCNPDLDKPVKLVRWTIEDKAPVAVLTLGDSDPVLDVDTDAAGQVLILREDGLWRWDGHGAPKLVRRGATAIGG
jgi:hypothetical protein